MPTSSHKAPGGDADVREGALSLLVGRLEDGPVPGSAMHFSHSRACAPHRDVIFPESFLTPFHFA